ncbi:STY4851/ECs_5259 family protein [Kalamiella sp. sgz302252]|uniref:STY4851/ECs_5259 family protein n=1 Tax=Pantoea sp. sgz302252 TaxID=3341827 RepID=UPI0036D275B5
MSQSEYIPWLKCTSWLSNFLNRRGLRQPDGRPLYEYHATNDEYANLTQLLCAISKSQDYADDKGYAACFVLFCSEWYRRDYERHFGWTWDPIYKKLGLSLTATELRNFIPKGMEAYWIRPIRFYESERRNFLGTLFSEGGLPFRLLKESDSHFQNVFSRILNQYEQAQLAGFSTHSLVRTVVEKSALPIVFSEDTSVELISHIAEKLSSLVLMYNLSNHTEPVKQLDKVHPKWRDEFPIPLDDETGNRFLNGLLCTASVEAKSRLQKNKGSGCQFYWSENHPDQIRAIISLPDELSFPILSEPSTTRFELAIYEDGVEVASLGTAYASLENAHAKVRLRKSESKFVRRQPAASLSIVARTGGMIVGAIKLEDSEIDIGEVPLTFVDDKDRWLLQGQASCSLRNSNVLIALPQKKITISGYEGPPRAVLILGLETLSVKGRQEVTISGEETYRIHTGREQSNQSGFDLYGKRVTWNCQPNETFLGVPKVSAKGLEIEELKLKRYLNGISLDECQVQEMMGTQYVSVRNYQNETLFRRKIGVLPADFNIEIKGGDQANEGSLVISTQHACMAVLKDKTLEVARKRSVGQTEISFKAEGMPPAFVSVQIYANLGADPIEMFLPFPAKGCLAFDANGIPLDKNITLHDLLGSRAFLFSKNGDPTRFSLELHLRSISGLQAWHEWRYTAGEHPVELNLYSLTEHIENLLSLETGIDQVVEMQIKGAGIVMSWQIRRYKYSLRYDYEKEILISQTGSYRSEKLPSPVIMLLSEPERKSTLLTSRMSEGVPIGEYELGSIVSKNGPWLIVPKPNEEMAFRPFFIRGEPSLFVEESSIRSLQKATQLFNPQAEVNTITLVLDQMAIDPAHSGWQFMRSLYDQFGYLPLATFEVWRALVQHPQALAMSLFKFEMSPDYLNRIENEFPVLWEFFPIYEIRNAAERFKLFLRQKGAPEETLAVLVKNMYQRLGLVFPTYADEIEKWLNYGILPPHIPDFFVREWYQELLREHSEARWPEYGCKRLHNWMMSQRDSVISIHPDANYRFSVACLPIFAAAVAAGKTSFAAVFDHKPGAVFFLRQVRDFDSRWFKAIFQYTLLRYAAEK